MKSNSSEFEKLEWYHKQILALEIERMKMLYEKYENSIFFVGMLVGGIIGITMMVLL
jgi:hypothetical protein